MDNLLRGNAEVVIPSGVPYHSSNGFLRHGRLRVVATLKLNRTGEIAATVRQGFASRSRPNIVG